MKRVDFFLKKKKLGFTLAEVLVTLAIIGIVSALTIPALIQNTRNDATVAGVRKAQSVLSQAYTSFVTDGTNMDTVFAGDINNDNVLNQWATKLNIVKNCGYGTGCFAGGVYKYLDGTIWNPDINSGSYATAILVDGTSIGLFDQVGGCNAHFNADPANPLYNVCGFFYVDINGFKGPTQFGRDIFLFYVTRTSVLPFGSNGDPYTCSGLGWGCASKVLTDGTVNY